MKNMFKKLKNKNFFKKLNGPKTVKGQIRKGLTGDGRRVLKTKKEGR